MKGKINSIENAYDAYDDYKSMGSSNNDDLCDKKSDSHTHSVSTKRDRTESIEIHDASDTDNKYEYENGLNDDDDNNAYDVNEFIVPITYLDSILNVNGLLKVIANSYYNKEIKNNRSNERRDETFEVDIEYTITIGYDNESDAQHKCYKTSPTLFLKINFNYLMRIFYWELIHIVKYKLSDLTERIEFCKEHKSFIILSLIYNYNYRKNHRPLETELIGNKTLFEYLFFECHYYELTKLFPRNHDLLLMHNYPLIEFDSHKWEVILNAMPKLIHYYQQKSYFPQRIIVCLSIDVELDEHSNVKWKEYFINPYLCDKKQTIVENIIIESCINWNNILIKRKEVSDDDVYPMIMLYYKIKCEYEDVNSNIIYTVESTVRSIHISTEIDMELNENQSIEINNLSDIDFVNGNDIENKLIICDNLILHENAKLYTSYLNIKCHKLIDIRSSAAIIADKRGLLGTNCRFYVDEYKNNNTNSSDDEDDDDSSDYSNQQQQQSKYGKGGNCYVSEYLNRSEVIFGSGGNGGHINNNDIIQLKYNNNKDSTGLFYYLGCNFGTNNNYTNPYNLGFVDLFCGGIGTRSNKLQNILNNNKYGMDINECDCYFISGKLNIWFAIDLKFCRIQLTHYVLHHIDIHSNYLRSWVLEGKNINDNKWYIISKHLNDNTINEPKGIGVFEIESNNNQNEFYQYFRIRMTDENSFVSDKIKKKKKEKQWSILNLKGVFESMDNRNNSFILCCSGIELYGNVILSDNYFTYYQKQKQMFLLNGIERKQFKYESDFDTNGILYWIGCNYGQNGNENESVEWVNPSQSLRVKVLRGKQSEKGSVDDITGRVKVKECYFLDYFLIDFRDIHILPNKYCMKLDMSYNYKESVHEDEYNNNNNNDDYMDTNTHCWCLKASQNGINWKIIKQHRNETIIDSASFNIDNCDEFYRYFKIENNSMLKELHCSGFEIYGMIKYNELKYKIPKLKSGGNSGGIINLIAPKCKLNNCIISVNGENGINCGGGGAAGNVLIDCNELEILGNHTRIQAIGGKGQININNDGQNGRIRLFCNQIYGDIEPQKCCNPKPFIL